jgi:hypothetical protein
MLSRCQDAEETEALVCLEGILFVGHWPPDVQVELADRSVIAAIIHGIKEAMGRRQQCLMKKIRRHQNQIAHNLAQYMASSLAVAKFISPLSHFVFKI